MTPNATASASRLQHEVAAPPARTLGRDITCCLTSASSAIGLRTAPQATTLLPFLGNGRENAADGGRRLVSIEAEVGRTLFWITLRKLCVQSANQRLSQGRGQALSGRFRGTALSS